MAAERWRYAESLLRFTRFIPSGLGTYMERRPQDESRNSESG